MRQVLFIFCILTTFATDEPPTGVKPVLKKLVKGGLIICLGSYTVMTGYSTWQKWFYGPKTHIPIGEACAIYNQNDAAMVQLQTALTIILPACCYRFQEICRELKDTIAIMCATIKNETGKEYLDEWATENNVQKCESCEDIKFFSYWIPYWKVHCLLGKRLQIEENGEKQNIVITNIGLLPRTKEDHGSNSGATRGAYDIGNGNVILLPKDEKGWKRLVEEETAIDKFYQQYIMTSGVKKATFDMNGTTNYALVAKKFISYKEQLGFVIDMKWFRRSYQPEKCGDVYQEWIRKIVPKPNLKTWTDMMEPIIRQYVSLINSGVACPSGDTLNYFFAGEGSPYAKNGKPSLYLFGFDFASNFEFQFDIRTVEMFKTATCSKCFPCTAENVNFTVLYYLVDILDLDEYYSKSFVPEVIRASKERLAEKLQSIQ